MTALTTECRGDVCEIRYSSTGYEDFALGMLRRWCHKIQDGLSVFISLLLGWSTAVLAVIRQFRCAAQITDRVWVNDTRTTACDHRPDAPVAVQDCQLQWCAWLRIQIGDVSFLWVRITTEWRRILDLAPLRTAHKIGSGINLGGQIENVDRIVGDNERINFQVCEVEIDVELIQRMNKLRDAPGSENR